jgi:hypothetical protein
VGVADVRAYGLGVVAGDLNEDGFIDLFISNDQVPNHLWQNVEGRNLVERAGLSGVAVNFQGVAEASMGVVLADFDNDGRFDLLMTHITGESHTLYRNLGGGLFDDRSQQARLAAASLPMTGFGVAALDFDNDGWVDLAVTSGSVLLDPNRPPESQALPMAETDLLLRNHGGRFEPVSCAAFDHEALGRGLAVGDLDNDGDSDLVLNDVEGPARVLINTQGQDRSWVGLILRDQAGLDPGEGVVVSVVGGDSQARQARLRQRGGSFLSSNDPRVLLGLGDRQEPVLLLIRWISGLVESFGPLEVRRYHLLQQGKGKPEEDR